MFGAHLARVESANEEPDAGHLEFDCTSVRIDVDGHISPH
jgi:hypothetical protein